MKLEVYNEKYGTITYEESFWTGKKNIYVNGVVLSRFSKTTFTMGSGDDVVLIDVVGNILKGVSLRIGNETIEIISKPLWYEYVLAFFPVLFIIVWGNSVALCEIVPVVGGMIGGFISGACGVLTLVFCRKTKNILLKVVYALLGFAIAFGLCALIGIAIVSSLA